MPSAVSDFLPRWTKKVVIKPSGRDPLGLSRVSEKITDFLLPAIITTTNRARYYSFYPWCFWHIRETEDPERSGEFWSAYQRREAAFAITSLLGESESTVVGTDKATEHLREAQASGEVDTGFLVLPSNPQGGYMQYYVGCVSSKLGLIGIDEEGFDYVTEGRGEQLAKAFQQAVEGCPYIENKRYLEQSFPLSDLENSVDEFGLDSVEADLCSEERRLLVEMFFSLGKEDEDAAPFLRRQGLGQILHLLEEYSRADLEVHRGGVLWSLVFWPHYYGLLYRDEGDLPAYFSPERFAEAHGMWRQYCLHQFTARALEEVLNAALDALSAHGEGLTLEELVRALVTPEFVSQLSAEVEGPCATPQEFLSCLGIDGIPDSERSYHLQKKLRPPGTLHEWDALEGGKDGTMDSLPCAVLALAMVYGKWRGIDDDKFFAYVAGRAGPELWAGSVFPIFDSWTTGTTASWEQAIEELLGGLVIRHHDEVMFQKGRLDACWISRSGDRYRKEQDIGPFYRSSRHENALSIMWDLRLVALTDEDCWEVTEDGEALMQTLAAIAE